MAVGRVGEISVKISGDDRDFQRAAKRTGTTLKSFGAKLSVSAGNFAAWGAKAAAAAIAVGTVMVSRQMKVLDSLGKTSDALKIQQERLQALQHVGELTGTSAEQLNTNLERMQRRLGNVARGQGPTKKALEDLGIEMQNLIDLPLDEQLVEVSKVLGNVENAATRASIANDIFGRDGVRMLKMLEQLKDEGLEPTVQELDKLGIALSRTDTAKVEAANDALFRVSEVISGIINKIAVELSPLIQGVSDLFINWRKEADSFNGTMGGIARNIVKFAGFIADTFQAFEGVLQVIEVTATGVLAAVANVAGAVGKVIGGMVSFAIQGLNKLVEAANLIPGIAIDKISDFGQSLTDASAGFADRFTNSFKSSIEELETLFAEKRASSEILEWFDDVQKKAEETAQKVTEATKQGGQESDKELKSSLNDKLSAYSGMFNNLSQLMNTESRKMFNIGKIAAKSGAIVDGIAAAVGSFKVGAQIGGPILGAAFATASLAATGAQIAAINSQQFGGGGSPTSFQGGQPSVNTNGGGVGPQQPTQNINIALNGSTFGSTGIRGLIGEINEALGDGVQLNVAGT